MPRKEVQENRSLNNPSNPNPFYSISIRISKELNDVSQNLVHNNAGLLDYQLDWMRRHSRACVYHQQQD
jgi:hypothetical protein